MEKRAAERQSRAAPAPAEGAALQVDGRDVRQNPSDDGTCAIRYTEANPPAGGVPTTRIVYGCDSDAKSRYTAIALRFDGWDLKPDDVKAIETGASDNTLKLVDTSWSFAGPNQIFIGTKNPDDVLGLLRKFGNLTIKEPTRDTVFAYTKPDAALAVLQPCLGRMPAVP